MSTHSPVATNPVRVFLSYAWESDAYRIRVEQLAVRLRDDGIDARLDKWHVGEQPIPSFMSSETRLAAKVLVVCSPSYQRKVESMEDGKRIHGAGWELMLVTGQLFADEVMGKVIPVLFEGTWKESAPLFLKSLRYYDLTDAERAADNYLELLRALTGRGATAPPVKTLPANIDPAKVSALRFPTAVPSSAPNLKALAGGSVAKSFDRGYSKTIRLRLNPGNVSANFLAQISDRLEGEDIAMIDWSLQHDGQCRLVATSQRPDLAARLRAILAEIKEIQSVED